MASIWAFRPFLRHERSARSPGSFARDVRTQTAGRRRVGRWSRFGPAERARHSLSLLGSMGTYSPSTKWRAISAKTNLCTGWYREALDGAQPYHTRVEDMAAHYVNAIRNQQPEGPYRLVGHSFGGIVAFEVAQQIVAQGGVVDFLGLFDTIERQYMEEVKRSLRIRDRIASVASEFRFAVAERDPFGPIRRRLNRMTSKAISAISPNIGRRPQSQVSVTIKDVNLRAFDIYHPKPYPGKLTLFRSTTREIHDGNDEFLGWGRLAKGGIEVHEVPSTHYNMVDEPAVMILSEMLRQCLDQDRGSLTPPLQHAYV